MVLQLPGQFPRLQYCTACLPPECAAHMTLEQDLHAKYRLKSWEEPIERGERHGIPYIGAPQEVFHH